MWLSHLRLSSESLFCYAQRCLSHMKGRKQTGVIFLPSPATSPPWVLLCWTPRYQDTLFSVSQAGDLWHHSGSSSLTSYVSQSLHPKVSNPNHLELCFGKELYHFYPGLLPLLFSPPIVLLHASVSFSILWSKSLSIPLFFALNSYMQGTMLEFSMLSHCLWFWHPIWIFHPCETNG